MATQLNVKTETRKIAVNKCYGGFGLSDAAFVEFMRLKGHEIYAEPGVIGSQYWRTPVEQQPEILRMEWYKVPDDQRDEYEAAAEAAGRIYEHDFVNGNMRDDPDLIAVIEQMGAEASGRFAEIEITEIPADVAWEIEEYDGREWVAEAHRTW